MTTSTHTDEYRAVPRVLKDARKAAGQTQQEFTDRLDKPQSYVAKGEGGERHIDIVALIALAQAVENDPMKLFRAIVKKLSGA